ncbi:hypothetical protein Riv7116_4276 [Rivularia sp. PCC 7116]|uniref:hypothetical protein n=1 Tax=Rivularia sp. PCC 7116 TaxID=373994 RepID=UPI00029F1457|nr:hypothetical protein [Rivularia sp. PCC 7116]AFY56705.1 hypothetical protein Riv7116_4276 [Rivularia sp. PCC 7116]
MYEHLEPLKTKLIALKIEKAPPPWQLKSVIAVGGLCSVGFDRDTDNLLIVSHSGRGVVDCSTGEKTTRDREYYYENQYLEAEGIGCLSGKMISMAGLLGGGLPVSTDDDWSLESVTVNFPEEMILLVEPGSDLYGMTYNRPDNFTKIEQRETIRAYGFSYTGQSFIIATSSDVTIYNRSNKLL